ncbi:hypothetical protein PYW07_000353 [Mythimna separata]|uniref:Reverse transcriptase domain-containing protein n=1 Tax=Mythimna separata TaxID=271217 RepID=A0AAD8E1F2_MYTSE|nr:hypothetical protein PYW07_000353 [Mythimna separata]
MTTAELDLLLIQETLLKPHRKDPKIANYRIVRNDRTRCHGGGTLIYFRKELYCVPIIPPAPVSLLEFSACRVGMTGHQPITVISAYYPPPSSSSHIADESIAITSDLTALFGLSDSVILAGDLNAKHPAWNSNITNPRGRVLYNLGVSLNFDIIAPMSHTHFPHDPNHSPDVLDVALLKNVNLRLQSIEAIHELNSDHRPVVMHLGSRSGNLDPGQPPPTQLITDWRKVSEKLKSTTSPQLDSIPDHIVSVADTTEAIDSLTNHVQSVLNDCSREIPAAENLRWKIPDEVRALMTEKNAAIRAYSAFPCDANKAHMRRLQRAVRKRMTELRSARWERTLSELEPTHHAFWHLQRKLRSTEEAAMPPLTRPDKSVAFDNSDKAECLADSLESQCSPSTLLVDQTHIDMVDAEVERRTSIPPVEDPDNPLPPVAPDEVEDIIRKLQPRKAPGADGITNRVFKLFPPQLIVLMTAIFNGALSNNMFPQAWKQATVIGIPKPGKPKANPTSYRPISLLNVLGKIYERLIYKRLKDYAETKGLIPNEQFGFRTEHSCIHQVHRIVEHLSVGFQRGMLTGVLYFDIAKAFDKVWHNGLIYKLYQLGVPDRLVLIMRDFLSNRSFRYRIEGALSSPHPIRAGVPQGSVVSPLAFTLYTSDIPKDSRAQLALFADDTAIYYTGRDPKAIARKLQTSANTLGEWFRKWRIEVNPDKSQAVLYSKQRQSVTPPPPITMYGKPIPWEKQAKYLGVILDQHLTFSEHIRQARSRAAFAQSRLHYLLTARSKLSRKCKLRLYTAVIRPIMTYACAIFAHAKPRFLHKMQTLQNRTLRKILGAPYYVRNENLHLDLKIPTIQQFMKRLCKRFFDSALKHRNPLIVSAARYEPSKISKIRRPRHTLTEPDDPITLLQESRRETSTVHKTRPPSFRPRRRGPSRLSRNYPPRPLLEPARAAEPVIQIPLNKKFCSIQPVPLLPSPSDALSRGSYPTGGALSVVA